MDPKNNPFNLILDEYDYNEWYKEVDDLPLLEDDEEKCNVPSMPFLKGAKEGRRLKLLTQNKLLIRLPVISSNRSSKQLKQTKNKIKQMFCNSIIIWLDKFILT